MDPDLQDSDGSNVCRYRPTQQTSVFVGSSTFESVEVLTHSQGLVMQEIKNEPKDKNQCNSEDVNSSSFCFVKVESLDYEENQVENSPNSKEFSSDFSKPQGYDTPLDLRTSSQTSDRTFTPPLLTEPKKETSFACVYCMKTFAQKRYLMTHLAVHGLRRPGAKLFKCWLCEKTFPYKHLVRKHELVHSDVKPFKCLTCGEEFRHKVSLVKHGYKHTGVKPVSCPHPGCDKTFTSRSHVKDHYRLHTGERPFACTICHKTFVQRGALNAHMQVHAGVKPYTCDLCSKCFTSKPSLAHHLRLHAKGVFLPIWRVEDGSKDKLGKKSRQRKISSGDLETKIKV